MLDPQVEYQELLSNIRKALVCAEHLGQTLHDLNDLEKQFENSFISGGFSAPVEQVINALKQSESSIMQEAYPQIEKLALMDDFSEILKKQRILSSSSIHLLLLLKKTGTPKADLIAQMLLNEDLEKEWNDYNLRVDKLSKEAINADEFSGRYSVKRTGKTRIASISSGGKTTRVSRKSISKGSIIKFGHYPKTQNKQKYLIEWCVLEKQSDRLLLLSKFGIDAQPFNDNSTPATWSDCSLRTWLSSAFINSAFDAREKAAIIPVEIKDPLAEDEQRNSQGIGIHDKIFLLSEDEVKKYFKGVYERRCVPTQFAIENGAFVDKNIRGETVAWWLRSPGNKPGRASCVGKDGSLGNSNSHHIYGCVRPAMWVGLDLIES